MKRALLEHLRCPVCVTRLDLTRDPEFAPAPPDRGLSAWVTGGLGWITSQLGQRPAPVSGITLPEQPTATDLVALELLKRLTVENDNRSYLVSVGFRAGNPASAAAIANAFADEYLQSRIETSVATAERQTEWLAAQLVEQRHRECRT